MTIHILTSFRESAITPTDTYNEDTVGGYTLGIAIPCETTHLDGFDFDDESGARTFTIFSPDNTFTPTTHPLDFIPDPSNPHWANQDLRDFCAIRQIPLHTILPPHLPRPESTTLPEPKQRMMDTDALLHQYRTNMRVLRNKYPRIPRRLYLEMARIELLDLIEIHSTCGNSGAVSLDREDIYSTGLSSDIDTSLTSF